MKKGVVIVLVFGLLGWFLYQFLQDQDADLRQAESGDSKVWQETTQREMPSRIDAASAREAAEPAPAEIEETRFGPLQALQHPEDGILIRCVDAETQEAVPEVDIFVPRDGVSFSDAMQLAISPQVLMRDYSRYYRADEKGEARVKIPDAKTVVVVFTDSYYAQAELSPETRVLTLELRSMPSVRARVVDQEGRGLPGVPVAWRVGTLHGNFRQYQDRIREISDGEGRVRLSLPGAAIPLTREDHALAVGGCFADQVVVPIKPVEIPDEEILLTMPPCGSVEVVVKTSDGRPLPAGPLIAHVEKKREEGGPGNENWIPAPVLPLENGRIRFDQVGLGLDLVVGLRAEFTGEFEDTRQSLVGPTRAGETVLCEFILDAEPTRMILSGRLLDARGSALSRTRMIASLSGQRQGQDWSIVAGSVVTDEQGRFRFGTRLNADRREQQETLLVEVKRGRAGSLRGAVEIASTRLGEIELGDLVLVEDDFLGSGSVHDGRGRPIAGLRVRADELKDSESDREWAVRRGLDSVLTDEHGAFVLYGKTERARMRLEVWKTGFSHQSRDVPVGIQDLRIETLELAEFRAQIVAQYGGELGCLDYALFSEYGGSYGRWPVGEIGALFQTTMPGLRDLKILTREEPSRVLYERKEIDIPEGAKIDLGRIEIEGAMKAVVVQLASSRKGESISATKAIFRIFEPGSNQVVSQVKSDPRGRIFVRDMPCDLEVEVPGFKAKRIRIDGDRALVELEAGPRLHMTVPRLRDFRLPADVSMHLVARLATSGGPRLDSSFGSSLVEGQVQLSGAGTYEFSLHAVITTHAPIYRRFEYPVSDPVTIQVEDAGVLIEHEVDVDPQRILEIIRKQNGS